MKSLLGIALLGTILVLQASSASAINVRSADIVDGQVMTVDLANNAVTSAKMLDGTVAGIDLATGAVSADKIQNGAVTNAKLGSDVAARMSALESQVAALSSQVAALQELLQHFSRTGNDVILTGANLQIVSGSGSTSGPVNGLGNLIVGYNQATFTTPNRTGSHNLVLGSDNNFLSYGGIIAGDANTIAGPFASVLSGRGNSAAGNNSSILGGTGNNTPSSEGGWGQSATISGGYGNASWGYCASVGGGNGNLAYGHYSTVGGGQGRSTLGSSFGMFDWVAGSLFQDQ